MSDRWVWNFKLLPFDTKVELKSVNGEIDTGMMIRHSNGDAEISSDLGLGDYTHWRYIKGLNK